MKYSKLLLTAVVFLFIVNIVTIAHAQSPQAVSKSDTTQPVISGSVIAKHENTLVIKNGELVTTLPISPETNIEKDVKIASWKDIQVGDQVAIRENTAGQIQEIQDTSA